MMNGTVNHRKYWIYGIIGCICFGIGDWLLGYVDPTPIHISDVAADKKTASRLRYTFGQCAVGWLVIHLLVSMNVMVYSWMMENAGVELANGISNLLGNAMLPCLYISYIFVGIPFILLIADILRGKTRLKRWEVVFTPLIWMVIINVAASIIPATAFSYGLYTFCMNGGMLVWFLYLLADKDCG